MTNLRDSYHPVRRPADIRQCLTAPLRCVVWSVCTALAVAILTGPVAAQKPPQKRDINKSFRDPDVERYVHVFEHEGRDIYDKRDAVLKACDLKPGMSVADIGAGTGLFSRLFAKQVGPTGHVYAVDIAKKFIDHIIETCGKQKIENVIGVVCTDKSVELAPESIDVAFICDTYHHFEYPRETMRSIYTALRPSGIVYLIDFVRIEGKSPEWILGHVRAGEEVFTKEIESVGFKKVAEYDVFKDNYFLKFQKQPAKP